jgi:hypothetical protein
MRQRNRMDLWTPAELAIYNAMREVEKMPASVTLTNAVIKLSEAQSLVADYLDESLDSTQADETKKCNGRCGMNYCDEYGCIENKPEGDVSHLLVKPTVNPQAIPAPQSVPIIPGSAVWAFNRKQELSKQGLTKEEIIDIMKKEFAEWRKKGNESKEQSPSVLSTDELLKRLEGVKYKAYGFPMVMLWRVVDDHHEQWSCKLRNEQKWKEAKDCDGSTPKEALQKLYNYCIEKGYLDSADNQINQTK